MQNNETTVTTFSVTTLTETGTQQRIAGETARDMAAQFMANIETGNTADAYAYLSAIEKALDMHTGTVQHRHVNTRSMIVQCRSILAELDACDVLTTDAYRIACDTLRSKLALLANYLPSQVQTKQNGVQARNETVSDLLRGLKSMGTAVRRTNVAYVPEGSALDALNAVKAAELKREQRKADAAKQLADAQAKAAQAAQATTETTETAQEA